MGRAWTSAPSGSCRGHGSKVDMVVGETDHSSYAILYYQKGRNISVKLYGRSSQVSDAVIDKFEQRLRAVGLSEDVTYYFPTYGFCDSTDEFHVLDGELWGPGDALGPPMGQAWPHIGQHMGSPALAGSWAQRVQTLTTPMWSCWGTPRQARRWQTSSQDGHQVHAGKTKSCSLPTWVRQV
ncbi:complement component C8 gamma chain isoform X2 [Melopsittacus undulatus]|uniref:complement component C8 gamma chain isoform X2 n=1 Tax=Melopsittacus undulatus TaxID=13146 RepID=UPI00146C543F|nr:complement component C8 gamma chain isoform X2 [Melopsittacus undulatus]